MKDGTGLLVLLLAALAEAGEELCVADKCLRAFQRPSDFEDAQAECVRRGGALVALRSAEHQRALAALLDGLPGRFWIGLRRAQGCPDPAAELRGYRWVSGDADGGPSDWEEGDFDGGCDAPRCVRVSDDAPRWRQAACEAPLDGFVCESSPGESCGNLSLAEGESAVFAGLERSAAGEADAAYAGYPVGTVATVSPSGRRLLCFQGAWRPSPWSCEILRGGCEHDCVTERGRGAACFCPPGRVVDPATGSTCVEAPPDDACERLGCEHACVRDGETPRCLCPQGYRLAPDGRSCVDFNDCSDERQCPDEHTRCVNTPGGFQCVCEHGYVRSDDTCVDEDECMSAPCEHLCHNLPGGFRCSCYDGFKVDPQAAERCKLHCGVEECPAVCDPNDRFQCFCPDGYVAEERPDATWCLDIDECSSYFCTQRCYNTFGGYECSCEPGYTLTLGFKCVRDEGSPTATTPGSAPPTPRPSGVSTGALAGIIVCTALLVVLLVFLAHHFLCGGGRLKEPEVEAHYLHHKSDEAR